MKYDKYIFRNDIGILGARTIYKFPNKYGASYSGGELAVLKYSNETWKVDCSTPVTNDVIKINDNKELEDVLDEIMVLKNKELEELLYEIELHNEIIKMELNKNMVENYIDEELDEHFGVNQSVYDTLLLAQAELETINDLSELGNVDLRSSNVKVVMEMIEEYYYEHLSQGEYVVERDCECGNLVQTMVQGNHGETTLATFNCECNNQWEEEIKVINEEQQEFLETSNRY